MSDWTTGYVADIGYIFGYYSELNPLRVRVAFINKGLVFPESGAACELGFGQGLSANLHAAASVTEWHGTDFNPSQAGFAQELAAVSGSGAQLYDESFAEFAQRDDLPDFDFIGLHGIWSWISDENRTVIVDFIRRKLKVGGVVYASYNTLPGWAAFAPMRHLMTAHAEVIGSEGKGIVARINDAIDFADKLVATNPLFVRNNPQIVDRIAKIKDLDRHYLAHEYFNKDWHPMHFATMRDWLESAKLTYACSAHYPDHVDAINLTIEQQKFLNEIPDAMYRESVRDFMVNQQFRRDYWVKGARQLAPLERIELMREQRIVLITPRADVSFKIAGSLGEAEMNADVYSPILDQLADHKVKTLGQLEQALAQTDVKLAQIMEAVLLLSGVGHIQLAQEDSVVAKARPHTDKINQHIMKKARAGGDVGHLASPLTGGGITVTRFNQLFLSAYASGKKQPEEWAEYVWRLLSLHGQKIIKDGKPLESALENLTELQMEAKAFSTKTLPVLKALLIV